MSADYIDRDKTVGGKSQQVSANQIRKHMYKVSSPRMELAGLSH